MESGTITHVDRESSLKALKRALEGKNLRLATSYFDFINVRLYDHEDKYEVKQQHYWMWSEIQQKLQEYEIGAWSQWYVLQPYVESGIVYIRK